MVDSKTVIPSKVPADCVGFSPSEIHDQLERILNSPEFNATDAQRAFLQYVIGKTLAGQAEEIKGYTVATEVLGRREDFDQATDPVVSIQANKLRRALERYYLVTGQNDFIRIDLPKGAYVPTFQQQSGLTGASSSHDDRTAAARIGTAWPSLSIQPLANLTGNPDLDSVGFVIASEIALELTRYQEINVYLLQPQERRKQRAADIGARFALRGSVHQDATSLKMSVVLTEASTGRQLWADAHRADLDPAHLLPAGESVARIVAGKIAAEYGIIARHLAAASRRKPVLQLTAYEALLRYYEFTGRFTRPTFRDALTALRRASEKEPEFGLLWSMLSRLYAINYATELFDTDTPIDEAVKFAQRGIRLDPANQRIRLALAYALMLADELPAARAEAEQALALNPDSFIFLENIGYVLALLGDWQRGCTLIQKAVAVNPYYNFTAHYALWLDRFRRRDYPQAYRETLNFRSPNLFWDHLAKAATLGQLGRIDAGGAAAARLLELKPDFNSRGRILIGHYIKSDEIVDTTIDGLRKVGVAVD